MCRREQGSGYGQKLVDQGKSGFCRGWPTEVEKAEKEWGKDVNLWRRQAWSVSGTCLEVRPRRRGVNSRVVRVVTRDCQGTDRCDAREVEKESWKKRVDEKSSEGIQEGSDAP